MKSVSKVRNLELPGRSAQFLMSPPFRDELVKKMEDRIHQAKKAAVMVLFYPSISNETHLVLILRKTYKGVHSAQVGFPGGRVEMEDQSLLQTAIRETQEEVGVNQEDVVVLKSLTEVYIPPSNFIVHPFLGTLHYTPQFLKQDDEVEDVLEIPLLHFLDDANVTTKPVQTSYNVEIEVPAFNLNNHVVWGATAMMLNEVKVLLKQVI
ncbi:MAG TPA: CoA pyrophosphatase [Flavobacteriaceae bacterium]|nr:CoA pyrophosphatase [Flavobacteriaceae bacterium]